MARFRKRINITLDPDLYEQAVAKKLSFSDVLEDQLRVLLSDAAPAAAKGESRKRGMLRCPFCGPRLAGSTHLMGDVARCNTCGRECTQDVAPAVTAAEPLQV